MSILATATGVTLNLHMIATPAVSVTLTATLAFHGKTAKLNQSGNPAAIQAMTIVLGDDQVLRAET